MASKQQPDTVKMKAGWGDVRDVIPEMVGVLEEQGWVKVEEEIKPIKEQTNGKEAR